MRKKLSSIIAVCFLSTAVDACATKEQQKNIQIDEQLTEPTLREKIEREYGIEAIAVYDKDKSFYDKHPDFFNRPYFMIDNNDPLPATILPQSYLTYAFFKQLNRFITHGQYDAAVASFLSADQRAYALDMNEYGLEGLLVNRLGLKEFLGYTIIDKNCDCLEVDYSTAKDVLESIDSIKVQKDTNSAKGLIEVRFKHDRGYIDHATLKQNDSKGKEILLPAGEPYLAQFTQHWDVK